MLYCQWNSRKIWSINKAGKKGYWVYEVSIASPVFVGAGSKGNLPLILSAGGTPYRGFLEGRVIDDKYALILHLTNFELKEPNNGWFKNIKRRSS